ncbi:MAG TPA: Xaa-Pro peptidase family protein [Gemmatimonadaceae bacterium]|nr:Xaa-Pro peptidase family protein [Gemmatimonadaceae bacterium]
MDRRSFVTALSATGAAVLARPGALGADTVAGRPAAPTVPATHHAIRTEYPPIAPLGGDVFARRLDRARGLARQAGADAILATSGATNFEYLVGQNFGRSERLVAVVVPVDGDPVLIAPSFEVERVRRGTKVAAGAIRGWEEDEDPFALLATALGPRLARAAILVEPNTEYWTAMRVQRALPSTRLVDGSAVFESLRLVKTAEELARMRRAVEITEDAIAASFDQLQPGMRDVDVAKIVAAEHQKRGMGGGALVQFGPQSALPHGGTVDAELRPGMVVLIDGGGRFQGYASDITRTRWFGDAPSPKFREIYNLVHDAQSAAIAAVRPGVEAQAIDRAARDVIAKAGYGEFFTHRLGHGMGMDGHEATYMVRGNTRRLEPGYVFSVEPGIYRLGEFGVRLEDDYVCTEGGGELLSRRAPKV